MNPPLKECARILESEKLSPSSVLNIVTFMKSLKSSESLNTHHQNENNKDHLPRLFLMLNEITHMVFPHTATS